MEAKATPMKRSWTPFSFLRLAVTMLFMVPRLTSDLPLWEVKEVLNDQGSSCHMSMFGQIEETPEDL
jgi:hypothetical protein